MMDSQRPAEVVERIAIVCRVPHLHPTDGATLVNGAAELRGYRPVVSSSAAQSHSCPDQVKVPATLPPGRNLPR